MNERTPANQFSRLVVWIIPLGWLFTSSALPLENEVSKRLSLLLIGIVGLLVSLFAARSVRHLYLPCLVLLSVVTAYGIADDRILEFTLGKSVSLRVYPAKFILAVATMVILTKCVVSKTAITNKRIILTFLGIGGIYLLMGLLLGTILLRAYPVRVLSMQYGLLLSMIENGALLLFAIYFAKHIGWRFPGARTLFSACIVSSLLTDLF